ncbi:MAG TPA: amino acid ABC transporter permease [Chthoniobacteraceae bacterium]|nr:amino acid ABC transporter permease [Chthoniobacteraceae bacterium]
MPTGNEPPLWRRTASLLLALGLVAGLFTFAFASVGYRWNWAGVWVYRRQFLTGWLVTVVLSVIALTVSTLIGVILALLRRSRFLPLKYLARIYVEVIRGTPLLVQLLIFFYVVATAFHLDNRYVVGVLTLSVFSGAYISEVIRAGIESVGKSQLDSARAIGLTTAQTYRYVIFPQAIRQVLPPLAGQFASLIKDSSLLSIIGISEFTLNAQNVSSYTYSNFESYLPLAFGYLILTLPISLWTQSLERRSQFET